MRYRKFVLTFRRTLLIIFRHYFRALLCWAYFWIQVVSSTYQQRVLCFFSAIFFLNTCEITLQHMRYQDIHDLVCYKNLRTLFRLSPGKLVLMEKYSFVIKTLYRYERNVLHAKYTGTTFMSTMESSSNSSYFPSTSMTTSRIPNSLILKWSEKIFRKVVGKSITPLLLTECCIHTFSFDWMLQQCYFM